MIELYFAPTANAQRVRLALEEGELPYKLRVVDLWRGEQNGGAFLALNPLGAVPVLIDSDGPNGKRIVLSQSVAILLYVAEMCGRFVPQDPVRRLAMMQWLMLSASDVAGTNTAINQLSRSAPEPSEANVVFFQKRLLKYLAGCDLHLSQHSYLAGEFSLADIALYPFVQARRALIEQAAHTHLVRWADMVAQRPAVRRAMAPQE